MVFVRLQRNIMYFVFLITSYYLFLLTSCEGKGSQVGGYGAPDSCATSQCPPYQVVHTQNEFEIRTYKNVAWASCQVVGENSYQNATRSGFFILLDYTMGTNQNGVQWKMTEPILVDILPKSRFHVYSYIPRELQKNLPTPNEDTKIKLVNLPRHKYAAVRRFNGFISDATIAAERAALKKSLAGTFWRLAAASVKYSVAGYSPPWELNNRVNEIVLWFH